MFKKFLLVFVLVFGFHFSLAESETVGVDVRTVGEVTNSPAGDSINIPLSDLADRISKEVPDKSKEILVFCASGGRSAVAKIRLEKMGYKKVKNIKTWNAWNEYHKAKPSK